MKTVLRLLLFVVIFSAYCVEAMKFKQNIVKNKKFLQTSSTKVPLFNVNKPQGWQKNRAPYSSIKSPSNLSFSQKKEYFQNLIKNKKSSLWLSQKPLPFEYQQKNVPTHITLDEKDPKLSEKILDIIKKLKVLIKKKSRNKRNDEEKKSEFDWTWLASGFTVVGLIGLNEYLDYLNKKKAREGYISHEPFNAVEGPALYPKEFYKYALDGEMAATMDPDSFIEELHNVGLTAEDPPKIQCQIQRENQLEELARIVNFTEEEKLLFQAILNLPRQLFKGHYSESNITFDGEFDSEVKKMVKDALEKADVPFKVRVHATQSKGEENILGATYLENHSNTSFKYHITTSSAGLIGESVDVVIYLSPTMLSSPINPRLSLDQKTANIKATIAHEVTHIAKLHSLEGLFAYTFFNYEKNLSSKIMKKYQHIIDSIHEYEADVLPLSDPEYARAQYKKFEERLKPIFEGPRYIFVDFKIRPDIYIPAARICALAQRAVKLHEAEKRYNEQKILLQGVQISSSK